MGDEIKIGNVSGGSAVAAGRHAKAVSNAEYQGTDAELASELAQLVSAIQGKASTPSEMRASAAVMEAAQAAKDGGGATALDHLAALSQDAIEWLAGHANVIGATMLTQYLLMKFGLG